jgi:peptidoglycan/LPS O-acetylase OafA/YrhL
MNDFSSNNQTEFANMKPETSVYLDLVRFCAALCVAFDHIADYTETFLWQLGVFGPQAVDVFFVLSGYVIAFATERREISLNQYVINRCARLYSVVAPTLTIGFLLGIIGTKLDPAINWGDTSVLSYLRCLFFTNQIWFFNVAPGYNGPFWSLGYEAWFYAIFAAGYFGKGNWRIAFTLICVALAGPRIILMFPLWLVGVAARIIACRYSITNFNPGLVWLSTMVVFGVLAKWKFHYLQTAGAEMETAAAWRTVADWKTFLVDYGFGILVAVNFVCFNSSAAFWTTLASRIKSPVRWLAGATFTLYLLHVPVAQFLAAISPWKIGTAAQNLLVIAGTFGIVFLVAQYTERKKMVWRNAIVAICGVRR